jgi:hypothetical protein
VIAARREDVAALHALTAAGRDIGGPWGFGTRHIRGKAARKGGGGGGSRKRPPALAKAPSKRKPKREEIEVPPGFLPSPYNTMALFQCMEPVAAAAGWPF